MNPRLAAFFKTLDWTDPVVDLIDTVTDFIMENEDVRRGASYEAVAERADALVMPRLK